MSKFAALWLICALVCGAMLFKTSQAVTDGRAKLDLITAETRREEDSLRVLQAEWSYLNQPDRLEKLAAQYLKLAPMRGKQFTQAQELPLRPVPETPAAPQDDLIAAIATDIERSATPQNAAATADEKKSASATEPAAGSVMPAPRKPADLRQPAAVKPAIKTEAPPRSIQAVKKQAPASTSVVAPAAKAAAVKPQSDDAARRSFNDVLDSLGGTP